ncbi:hypothetical protein [Desulfocurvibacter africanus]|uniref:hypothetical protein n=1 Tax=Desulfocurvibacter africanus TaxID=873 RepID=UPI0003FBAFE9|nr:hypothetical protein [Desulfocurvibacter africanus]
MPTHGLQSILEQIAFKTPAPALTAQVNCAYAYAAASHADAWLAEHFQKQNALKGKML